MLYWLPCYHTSTQVHKSTEELRTTCPYTTTYEYSYPCTRVPVCDLCWPVWTVDLLPFGGREPRATSTRAREWQSGSIIQVYNAARVVVGWYLYGSVIHCTFLWYVCVLVSSILWKFFQWNLQATAQPVPTKKYTKPPRTSSTSRELVRLLLYE